jgi:hypothetical protein
VLFQINYLKVKIVSHTVDLQVSTETSLLCRYYGRCQGQKGRLRLNPCWMYTVTNYEKHLENNWGSPSVQTFWNKLQASNVSCRKPLSRLELVILKGQVKLQKAYVPSQLLHPMLPNFFLCFNSRKKNT